MGKSTQFFAVVYALKSGRMKLCPHAHGTLAAARECAKELNEPMKIMEWQQDRRPQFMDHPIDEN